MKRAALLAVAATAVAGLGYAWQTAGTIGPALPLRLVGEYPLSGKTARFDYAVVDSTRGTIWLAHMGDGIVEAFDVTSNRVTRTVRISPPTSVRQAPASCGSAAYDVLTRHVFVTAQTCDEVAEIDPVGLKIVRRYPLPGCASPHGVIVDAEERTAYVGCRPDAPVVRLDLRSGAVDGAGAAGGGIGITVLALDAGLHRLYVGSDSGVVSVYDVADRRFHRIAQAFVHRSARVAAVDPATHRVYFPLQNADGRRVMRVMAPL